jgi:hypothetical protein
MIMKKANDVYVTTDYNAFTYINGNRNINKANFRRLLKSMKEKYIPIPIIVNKKRQIIDGQHRFEAAKFLKKEVYFMKINNLDLDEVRRLNENTANWNNNDRLQSFCELGYPEYLKFKEFMQKTGFNYTVCISLLSDSRQRSGEHGRMFKSGDFKIKNYERALENAKRLDEIGNYYSNYKSSNFLSCMIELFYHADYDHKRMIQKLKCQSHMIPKTGDKEIYFNAIRDIYNFKVPRSQKVGFF